MNKRWLLLVLAYGVMIAGWLGFAHWVAPALVVAAHEGRSTDYLNRLAQGTGMPRKIELVMEDWWTFSTAGALAAALHLMFIFFLGFLNREGGAGSERRDRRIEVVTDAVFIVVGLVFYAVTVYQGRIQDYYFYMDMWREVWRGHDPWFMIMGAFGNYPMNAYGPLFNVLAVPAWMNSLLPKLLFASAYLSFAAWVTKSVRQGRSSLVERLLFLTWLFNPYVWVEIPMFGHFDVLVGLCCVAAVAARVKGRDVASAVGLAAGFLIKLMPIVLLPFLILDGRRFRLRLLIAALGAIAAGLAISVFIWGTGTFRPLLFAARRSSQHLSIFRYLNGKYSPLRLFRINENIDILAGPIMLLGFLRAWNWSRKNQVYVMTSAVLAILVVIMFYRVGFPQYQMVLFVLATYWLCSSPREIRDPALVWAALACHFGWLAVFDVTESLTDIDGFQMQEWIGLPTFILECLLAAAIVHSARVAPESAEREPASGVGLVHPLDQPAIGS